MKKTNKKQIPKVRLPKYYVGGTPGFNESMYDSSQDNSTQGTKDAYNEKRKGANAGQYAQAGLDVANVGMQMQANQGLDGEVKNQRNAQAIGGGIDSIASSATPWYALAKGASNMGKGFTKQQTVVDPTTGKSFSQSSNRTNQAFADTFTPMHETAIKDFSEGNAGRGTLDILTGGVYNTMDNYLKGTNKKQFEAAKANEATYNQQQQDLANQQNAAAQEQQNAYIQNAVQQGIAANNQGGGGSTLQYGKYGGQMKFAMGGMQYANGGTGEINAEVEGGGYNQDGENAVAPNGEFTQFNGPTHAQGGIQTDMAPGTRIFSAKLNPVGSKKSFAKLNESNNTNREDKLEAKGNLDPKSKTSIDLTRMAKMKNSDMLFAMQEQLKKDKVAAYAKKMGVELPPMDNEQMEPQGEMPMAKYGGIHINPANKGKFTASAQRAGMGTQEFANHVLANKEDYSSTQVKRANFAHNAAGWKHEMGGMQQYALGGVQLPYYNTDRNGNPKYAMGGDYPAMTNPYHKFKGSIPVYQMGGMDGDLTPVTTSTVAPTAVKIPTDFKTRNEFDTFYKSQPGLYAPNPQTLGKNPTYYPKNKYSYNKDTNIWSYIDGKPVEFNSPLSSDLIGFTPKDTATPTSNANWQTNQLLRGGGNKLTFPSGDTQIVAPKKVLAYGGKMPKYALGGEEDNELGYTPKNLAEAYRMQQAAKMNNARYSQKSSYSPNVLPWEKTNDSENTPNNPYVNSKVNPYNNIDAADRKAEREAREAAEIAGTGATLPTEDKTSYDWKGMAGNIANFAAQNAGNIYNLSRYNKPEIETYERAKASYLDNTAAMRDAEQEARRDEYAVRGASGGNAGTYLANRVGLNTAKVMNKDRLRQQYANANAQIGNQNAQFNADIAMREVIANAQNRARDRSGKGESIGEIAKNIGIATKANKQGEMDQKTLALIMKYYNTPEFQKMMKDNKFT